MTTLKRSQQAARELLKRRRARANLVDFARYTCYGYIPSDHHFQICEKLEAIERGEIKRLMILMPPRHGKSELASRRFPAWFLGRNTEKSIIAGSYNSDLAGDFGREVRNIVASPEYEVLFKMRLAADSKSASRWHADGGGGYVAAGVGTAVTGRGAHLLLIDDPFKDRKTADSQLNRDTVYNWYMSTAYTRLEGTITEEDPDELWRDPGQQLASGNIETFDGAIVLIMTHWHEDDLAGRLKQDMKNGADQFDILSLPATTEKDTKALWPGKYPIKRLLEIKKVLPSREWEALYQQNPTPEDGTFFKRKWFKRFHFGEEPKTNNYQSSDFATKEGEGDFTELGIFGMDAQKELWIKAWWYDQATTDVWINEQLTQYDRYGCFAAFGETGQIRRAVEPFQIMRSRQRFIYPRFEWIPRTGDKPSMARSFQGMASAGMIHIPYTEWGDRLINQLCMFPAGKYDDGVDVCALMAMAIQMAHPAIVHLIEELKPAHPGYGWDDEEESSWRTA